MGYEWSLARVAVEFCLARSFSCLEKCQTHRPISGHENSQSRTYWHMWTTEHTERLLIREVRTPRCLDDITIIGQNALRRARDLIERASDREVGSLRGRPCPGVESGWCANCPVPCMDAYDRPELSSLPARIPLHTLSSKSAVTPKHLRACTRQIHVRARTSHTPDGTPRCEHRSKCYVKIPEILLAPLADAPKQRT